MAGMNRLHCTNTARKRHNFGCITFLIVPTLSSHPSAISPARLHVNILHPNLNSPTTARPQLLQTACHAIIRLAQILHQTNYAVFFFLFLFTAITPLRQTSCSHILKWWKTPMQIFSIKADFGGAIHTLSSPSFSPRAQPLQPELFRVRLVFITFHNHQTSLVRIYPKTNLDYFKYPTYNFPPLRSIPFDSRLTHTAPGPIGVRLWGALKPLLLIPFHHLSRVALKPRGQLLPFFFQTAQCGLANSQSESCLHSVTDNALAPCQPIRALHTRGVHL